MNRAGCRDDGEPVATQFGATDDQKDDQKVGKTRINGGLELKNSRESLNIGCPLCLEYGLNASSSRPISPPNGARPFWT